MSQINSLDELERRLMELHPVGMSPNQLKLYTAEKARIGARIARLRLDEAESWSRLDWLAMVERSLDLLGSRVARWIGPDTRH